MKLASDLLSLKSYAISFLFYLINWIIERRTVIKVFMIRLKKNRNRTEKLIRDEIEKNFTFTPRINKTTKIKAKSKVWDLNNTVITNKIKYKGNDVMIMSMKSNSRYGQYR